MSFPHFSFSPLLAQVCDWWVGGGGGAGAGIRGDLGDWGIGGMGVVVQLNAF